MCLLENWKRVFWNKVTEFPHECFYKKLTPARVAKSHGYDWYINIYQYIRVICLASWDNSLGEQAFFVKMKPFWGNNFWKISVSKLALKQIWQLSLHLFSALGTMNIKSNILSVQFKLCFLAVTWQLNRWPCHWVTDSLTHSVSHFCFFDIKERP